MAVIKPSAKTTPVKATNTKTVPAGTAKTAPKTVAKVDAVTFVVPVAGFTPNCVKMEHDWKANPSVTIRTIYGNIEVAEALSLEKGDEVEVTLRKVTR